MASRRRSTAAKAEPTGTTHLAISDPLSTSVDHIHPDSDDGYQTVSKVLSLYGITGVDLEESFRNNKTEFAAAVVDRFYKRDRTQGLLSELEAVKLVDIRHLKTHHGDKHLHQVALVTGPATIIETPEEATDTNVVAIDVDDAEDFAFIDADPIGDTLHHMKPLGHEEEERVTSRQDDSCPSQNWTHITDETRDMDCSAVHPEENDGYDQDVPLQPRDVELPISSNFERMMGKVDCPMESETSQCYLECVIQSCSRDSEPNELKPLQQTPEISVNQGQSPIEESESMSHESPASIPYIIGDTSEAGHESSPMQMPSTDDQGTTDDAESCMQSSIVHDAVSEPASDDANMNVIDGDDGCNAIVQEEALEADNMELTPDNDDVTMIIRHMKECKDADLGDNGTELVQLDTMGSTVPTSRMPDISTISATSIDYEELPINSQQDGLVEFSGVCIELDVDNICDKSENGHTAEDSLPPAIDAIKSDIFFQEDAIVDDEPNNHVPDTLSNVVHAEVACEERSCNTQDEAVTPEDNSSPSIGRYHSIQSDANDTVTFHDVESARPSFDDIVMKMISCVDIFRQNVHRVPALLSSLDTQQIQVLKPMVDNYMRTATEDADANVGQLTFVLLIFLEMSHKDPIKLSIFVQLVLRVTATIASPEIDQELVNIYRLLLESVGELMAKELSFEAARTLMDAFVGIAFQLQNDKHPIFSKLRILVMRMVDRCTVVDEYNAVIHMLNSRVAAGASHSKLITTLILRLVELILSSAAMDNPFHEARNAVHQLVETALTSNFSFLKALVDSFIKANNDITAHFIMLFIARQMLGCYRDEAVTVLLKRRCLRLLQAIAVPVFDTLNDVEMACGFIQQYVSCFPAASTSIFKLTVFDLSLLEGCGKVETPRGRQPFDEDALRETVDRYMTALGCNALQNGKLCDLVMLLSFKHVARVNASGGKFSKMIEKRRLQRQSSSRDCHEAEHTDRSGDTKKPKCDDAGDPSLGNCPSSSVSSRRSSVPILPLNNMEYISDETSDSSGHLNSVKSGNNSEHVNGNDSSEQSMECRRQFDTIEMLHNADFQMNGSHINNGIAGFLTRDLEMERVVRYARIVCRLFAATRGNRVDGTLQPEMAQYLLMPSHTFSNVEDASEAETCFKLILYHIYSEVFISIWRTMTNVLYSTNDYSQLCSASTFLYTVVAQRFEYLQYRVVRKLVVACMGDQCYMVRLTAVKLLSELFKRPIRFDDCISDTIMDKLILSMRDVNWKVRLVATTAIFHYVRRSGIDLNVMPAIAAVAERACDLEKEQQAVRDVVLSTLAFSLFSTRHPFLVPAGNMDTRIVALTDRFVKIILYKMSAFKARDNQVKRVLEYFKDNFIEVEGKEESSFLHSLSKLELKSVVENHAKTTLEKWMNLLLDLFLLRRSEGASFHVLAEVLCVLKLFGQVNPQLFATHLAYFIPYLKVDADDTFDASRIDVMVLVCSLVAISSGHSKDLQEIDHHVLQLVSFDAPALTRAAITLLVELGSFKHISAICEETFDYLSNLRSIIEKERSSPEAIVKVMSYNVLLRSAWKLGCIAEFADLALIFPDQSNWPQQMFDLILSMACIFHNARLYNVAGMLVQSIARIFMNVRNLIRIDFKGVKSVVKMFEDEPMVMCVMMLLYQLLATYAQLAVPSESDIAVSNMAKVRCTQSEVFCCLGSFVEAFVHLVAMDDRADSAVLRCAEVDLVMTLEICNLILVNRLTNPEPIVTFIFCHIVSHDPNVQRLAEQALKTLARNDPEIFMAKLRSCIQSLFLSVVIDSFAASVSNEQTRGTRRNSVERRSTMDSQTLEQRRRNSQSKGVRSKAKQSLTDISNGSSPVTAQKGPATSGQGFIFGYEAEFTAARVRGIVRLFLEAITSVKYSKKLVSIVIAQLSACMTRDFREALTVALERRNIQPEGLRHIKSSNSSRLSRMLMKQIGRARNGDPEGLVDYFTVLFVDMLATVLDHLTFRDANVARFLVKCAGEVMKSCDEVAADNLWKYRDSRLASLSSKIKQFYA